jgi:hypothetical protein
MEDYRDLDRADLGAYTPDDVDASWLEVICAAIVGGGLVSVLGAVCVGVMVCAAIFFGFVN